MSDIVLLYTTWPNPETAETVAAEAIAERLAACANVLAPMRSIYRWKGAIEEAQETPMILKTTGARAEALRDFLVAKHPYEVPAVLALETRRHACHAPFLDWVAAQTAPE